MLNLGSNKHYPTCSNSRLKDTSSVKNHTGSSVYLVSYLCICTSGGWLNFSENSRSLCIWSLPSPHSRFIFLAPPRKISRVRWCPCMYLVSHLLYPVPPSLWSKIQIQVWTHFVAFDWCHLYLMALMPCATNLMNSHILWGPSQKHGHQFTSIYY